MESSTGRMKLKLIQTGGFAGLTKSCEKEMDLSRKDVEELVGSLAPADEPAQARDALTHILVINDKERIYFSPEATRGKWKPAIDKMISELKYDKAGG